MGVFTSIKALCHAGLAAWHLYLPKKMVEAGGIEPTVRKTDHRSVSERRL